jgi:glutamate dehydrogenase
MKKLWHDIETLDFKVAPEMQLKMMIAVSKLVRRSSRWFIKRCRENLNIDQLIKTYKPDFDQVLQLFPATLSGERKQYFIDLQAEFKAAGVPKELAAQVASCDVMFSALDIIEEAKESQLPLKDMLKAYFDIGEKLQLSWLRHQIHKQKNENHWEGLALAGILDDLDHIQRKLASGALLHSAKGITMETKIKHWCASYERLVTRWEKMIVNMRTNNAISSVMLFVGLRELTDLLQTCNRDMDSNAAK